MKVTESLAKEVNIQQACAALAVPRASFYRWQDRDEDDLKERQRPVPPLALSGEEEKAVLEILHADRFVDQAPLEIYNTLLDEGGYICSVRTMYRILEKHEEVKERRNQLTHPHYQKPELLACAPNQLWSWDITKLKGPVNWTYYYLYVIIDVFSRYVVGWMVAHRELSSLAQKLIEQTCEKQKIQAGQLTIHADRGPSMKSKPVAFLMADLGITKSHSRPYVSNDNPYSESQFKTPQVSARVSGTVRLHRGCPIFLSDFLPLVQYRPLPFRNRFPHSGRCSIRTGWANYQRTAGSSERGLYKTS